jgi:hypothetical protein
MNEPGEHVERLHCNTCALETKHRRIARHTRNWQEPEDGQPDIVGQVVHELFECRGCEEVTLRESRSCSEDDPEAPVPTVYYPPRTARQLPSWLKDLADEDIAALFIEVYEALQADSRRLAMMGCRAILDLVMQKQVGDDGTFTQKLAELEKRQLVSTPNRESLEAAIDAGSASAHRRYLPTSESLALVVSIVENVVQATILHKASKRLRRSTPRRRKARPKPGAEPR